jgi:hypothetical protein
MAEEATVLVFLAGACLFAIPSLNRPRIPLRPDPLAEESSMPKSIATNASNLEKLDRFYRQGGLLTVASPNGSYDDPHSPYHG